MEPAYRFVTPPEDCSYLADRVQSMVYESYHALTPGEYMVRMRQGWRRFGRTLFQPRCPQCRACQSLRVDVRQFRPNRSQRRVRRLNEGVVRLSIGTPSVSPEKLDLHDLYHAFQADFKGWPMHEPQTDQAYRNAFVDNPFPTREYCYYLEEELVGVGYVDDLPAGHSAIYFFYSPEHGDRSLGTWNVLNVLDQAARSAIPYVYLGYYVVGCRSMAYKANFTPNQLLGPDGVWRDFQGMFA